MNKPGNRELFSLLVKRKGTPVLSWIMSFFNKQVAGSLLGESNIPFDCMPSTEWKLGASDRDDWERKVKYANATGNFAIGVGWGANIAFGHGGPGEFRDRLVEKGNKHWISEYETGVKKEVRSDPYFYRHFDYPVKTIDELEKMLLPDPDNQGRYKGIAEETAYYRERDFVTYANINGFFSGLHYYLCPYDDLLAALILEPDFIDGMLQQIGTFNLKAAENLLRCGVDMITFCDDLGSGSSLLMSPELYLKFFYPWHKKLADLCHKYGAYLHMHSHGNINRVMDYLYDAGIDILNPNDPYEGMYLPGLKQKYGDRIIFAGGLDKFFFDWEFEKQDYYIKDLMDKAGGGFILMDSGGIPESMTPEKYEKIRMLFEKARN